jgi:CheY-like chemotaxis protein
MNDLSGWSAIIVEDDPDAQEVLAPLLQQHHIHVAVASSGEDALELMRLQPPTFAIIDLHLPAMDGWQLLESMRSDPALAGISAVAITAYHSTQVADAAYQAGFSAFFAKPINAFKFVDDLVSALS